MQAKPFIITVITVNLCFICLHIHKYNAIVDLADTKKQLTSQLVHLHQHNELLNKELSILQDTKLVTEYAQKQLHMRPIAHRQIRNLSEDIL